jgi:hypothetical protein
VDGVGHVGCLALALAAAARRDVAVLGAVEVDGGRQRLGGRQLLVALLLGRVAAAVLCAALAPLGAWDWMG